MNGYGKRAKRQSVTLAETTQCAIDIKKMMSEHCYEEFVQKLTDQVGESNAKIMLPSIIVAIVKGGREERERILINWLDMDSCRVCTTCGAIMEEGWYLNDAGYACSDECAAKSEGITMDEFKRYKIYSQDIKDYLCRKGDSRNLSELSDDECAGIINDKIDMENLPYYWTEWY